MNRKCKYCGCTFWAEKPEVGRRAQMCSDACRSAAREKTKLRYRYRQYRIGRCTQVSYCVMCSQPFKARRQSSKRLKQRANDGQFCSSRCWYHYKEQQATVRRQCNHCGIEFLVKRALLTKRPMNYCSQSCAGAARESSSEKQVRVTCRICNREAYTRVSLAKDRICKGCYVGAQQVLRCVVNAIGKEVRRRLFPGQNSRRDTCMECGKVLKGTMRRVYCSKSCGWRHLRRIRRARKRHVYIDTVELGDVAKRDGWLCQICGEPVDMNTSDYLRQPTIDHIQPLSRGGLHSITNCQLAHFSCNSRKGARLVPLLGPGLEG